jgi:hypothetical protein
LVRAASGVPQYRLDASSFDPQLAPQHAQNGNTIMDFSPDYPPDAATPAGLAYALYRLNATAYAEDASLRTGWIIPPAPGTGWVALADLATDSWDWHGIPASGIVLLPEGTAPHTAPSGDLLVLVAVTGTANACELSYVRLGNEPPLPEFTPAPQNGPLPLTVTFDASLSRDPDGTIAAYAFDYGEGGGYEGVPGPTGQHTYTQTGLYTITMRITDNEGGWSQCQQQVSAGSVSNHAPVAFDQFHGAIMLTSISFSLYATDEDPGEQLTYEIVTMPQHGNLDTSNLPNVRYLPTATGTDSFTFRAFDGKSYSNTATVTINTAPGDGP